MSWTDIFKSKKGNPDPRVRWFGKLPTYADYYSSKTDESWAVEFNDWILKGYELLRSRLSQNPSARRSLPHCMCAVRLPKSGMTVFAAIMDYGGDMRGRPFPISFYAGIPSSHWPGPTSDRLAYPARVLRDLADLRRDVVRFINSPAHFETAFSGRVVDLAGIDSESTDTSWERQARTIRLEDWFNQAKQGLKPTDWPTWLRGVLKWGDDIAALESKEFSPTLRFPLAEGISVEVQLAGWILWLEQRMNVRDRYCSVLVSGVLDDPAPRLSVVARELLPDDFLLLSDLAGSLPYIDDVSQTKADLSPPDPAAPADPRIERLNAEGTWIDFARTMPGPT